MGYAEYTQLALNLQSGFVMKFASSVAKSGILSRKERNILAGTMSHG
jgi:hypothetical protein